MIPAIYQDIAQSRNVSGYEWEHCPVSPCEALDDYDQYDVPWTEWNFFSTLSIATVPPEPSALHLYPLWISVNLAIIFGIVLFWRQKRLATRIFSYFPTVGHYTVFVSNLSEKTTEAELRAYFAECGTVEEVLVVPKNANEQLAVSEKIRGLQSKMRVLEEVLQLHEKRQEDMSSALAKLRKVERKLDPLLEKYRGLRAETRGCGYAFVSFMQQEEAERALAGHKLCCGGCHCDCCRTGERLDERVVRVRPAMEPSDVLYGSLAYSGTQRVLRVLAALLGEGAAVAAIVYVITKLYQLQGYTKDQNVSPFSGAAFTSYLASLAVVVLNVLFGLVIAWAAKFMKLKTLIGQQWFIAVLTSSYQYGILQLSLIFSTAVPASVPLEPCDCNSTLVPNPDYLNRVCYNLVISSVSLIVGPLLFAIDPAFLLKRLLVQKTAKSQEALNAAFCPPEFPLALRYSASSALQSMTWFWGPVFPPLFFITAFGLTLNYWADKFYLLRMARHVPNYSPEISNYAYWQLSLLFTSIIGHASSAYPQYSLVGVAAWVLSLYVIPVLLALSMLVYAGNTLGFWRIPFLTLSRPPRHPASLRELAAREHYRLDLVEPDPFQPPPLVPHRGSQALPTGGSGLTLAQPPAVRPFASLNPDPHEPGPN